KKLVILIYYRVKNGSNREITKVCKYVHSLGKIIIETCLNTISGYEFPIGMIRFQTGRISVVGLIIVYDHIIVSNVQGSITNVQHYLSISIYRFKTRCTGGYV